MTGVLLACAIMGVTPSADLNPIISTDKGVLTVNYVKVLTLKQWQDGLAPAKVVEKAGAVIYKYGKNRRVSSVFAEGSATLMMDGATVLKVSKAEAQAQNSDLKALADLWAGQINTALNLPAVALGMDQVVVPEGGTAVVPLVGAGALKGRIDVGNGDVVAATGRPGELLVKGVSSGKSSVSVVFGEDKASLKVTVMPVGMRFPQTVTAEVFGQPASAEIVASAAEAALRTRTTYLSGTKIDVPSVSVKSLAIGESTTVSVNVTASGEGLYPSSGAVKVTVRNVGAGRVFEDMLWYSNEPENLLEPGQLYWGRLNAEMPVRLLAHHYNKTSAPMVVQYFLVNRDVEPANIATIVGDAEPNKDPAKAGYQAGDKFFKDWLTYSAEVVRVPARSAVPLFSRRIGPVDTMSGLASLRLMGGGSQDVVVVAYARWARDVSDTFKSSVEAARPWQKILPVSLDTFDMPVVGSPKLVFRKPFKEESFDYQVGGKFAFIRIGQNPISAVDGTSGLEGNFGVHYLIDGTLQNTTDAPQKVEIVFEASAGYSGALFMVNNEYKPAGILQAKQTYLLWSATLNPGDKRAVRIQTMPLSGAHYPATITVRPVGAL